jgi:hypothetical protein
MVRQLLPVCAVVMMLIVAPAAFAQRPVQRLRSGDAETAPRRAKDQIEGSIYQFSATLPKSKDERLTGRFRIEGTGIFNVEKEIDRPDVRETVRKLRDGEGPVTVPTDAREQRIGDVVSMGDNKYKLEFMDFETLPGFAIISPKPDHKGVWTGYFQELNDGKAGKRWRIEIRASED